MSLTRNYQEGEVADLQSDPLALALRASATPLNGFLMAAKAASLAPVTPPLRRDLKGPRGLGPPGPPINNVS